MQAASYLQDNQRPQTDEGAAKDAVSKAQATLGTAKETVSKAQADLATAQPGADKTKLDEAQKDAEKRLTEAQKDLDAAKEAADPEGKFHAAIAKLSDTGIPMGWDGAQLKALDLEAKDLTPDQILNIPKWATWFSGHITVITSLILGWFLTALAASLGAPFWFDTLSRIMNIRNSGKHPGEMDPASTPVKPPSATLDQTPRGG
jgi:multidrug efflux pump subunit AcrA (membrane-fusion protein)